MQDRQTCMPSAEDGATKHALLYSIYHCMDWCCDEKPLNVMLLHDGCALAMLQPYACHRRGLTPAHGACCA
jgi:hypothetical protein